MQHLLLRLVGHGRLDHRAAQSVDRSGPDLAPMALTLDRVSGRHILTLDTIMDALPDVSAVAYVVVLEHHCDTLMSFRDRANDHATSGKMSFDGWLASKPFSHVASWWPHRRLFKSYLIHASDLYTDSLTEIAALAELIGPRLRPSQARSIATKINFQHSPRAVGCWTGAPNRYKWRRYGAGQRRALTPACISILERRVARFFQITDDDMNKTMPCGVGWTMTLVTPWLSDGCK